MLYSGEIFLFDLVFVFIFILSFFHIFSFLYLYQYLGITLAALFTSVFLAKKFNSYKKYGTFSSSTGGGGDNYFSYRNIKKDFSYEDLVKSVTK